MDGFYLNMEFIDAVATQMKKKTFKVITNLHI